MNKTTRRFLNRTLASAFRQWRSECGRRRLAERFLTNACRQAAKSAIRTMFQRWDKACRALDRQARLIKSTLLVFRSGMLGACFRRWLSKTHKLAIVNKDTIQRETVLKLAAIEADLHQASARLLCRASNKIQRAHYLSPAFSAWVSWSRQSRSSEQVSVNGPQHPGESR